MTFRRIISRLLRPFRQRNLRLGRAGGPDLPPLELDDLRATCHRALPADPSFASAWNKLAGATPSATPFQRFTWQNALIDRFVPPGRLRLITVHRADDLLGVLPLSLGSDGTLENPGRWVSDYLDPLISPADEPASWRIILALLRRLWDRTITKIELHNVRASAACMAFLPQAASAAGFTFDPPTAADVCVQIPLPKTWDEYLAARPKDERIEFRRRLKKAEAEAGAALRLCENPADFSPALDKALSLMEARGGEKGQAIHDHVRPFLMSVGPDLMRRGELRLFQLILQGNVAGALVTFAHPTGPLIYNTGFDPAYRIWGPGVLGSLMVMRQAIAAGQTVFDLLRGREEYKLRLGGVESPLYQLALRPRSS